MPAGLTTSSNTSAIACWILANSSAPTDADPRARQVEIINSRRRSSEMLAGSLRFIVKPVQDRIHHSLLTWQSFRANHNEPADCHLSKWVKGGGSARAGAFVRADCRATASDSRADRVRRP